MDINFFHVRILQHHYLSNFGRKRIKSKKERMENKRTGIDGDDEKLRRDNNNAKRVNALA
jgi:hypothetical protein